MRKEINTFGDISRTIQILEEASQRNDALNTLAKSTLPEDLKAEIFTSYKTLRRKQTLLILPILFGWLLVISLIMAFSGLFPKTFDNNPLLLLLIGAFVVLPVYFIFKAIFKGDTEWDKYYDWWKNSSVHDMTSLFHLFGIKEETAAESNERIAQRMKENGNTQDQINAVIASREKYQKQKGLLEETEEDINERLIQQMKDNGYTNEQIEKAMGKR